MRAVPTLALVAADQARQGATNREGELSTVSHLSCPPHLYVKADLEDHEEGGARRPEGRPQGWSAAVAPPGHSAVQRSSSGDIGPQRRTRGLFSATP